MLKRSGPDQLALGLRGAFSVQGFVFVSGLCQTTTALHWGFRVRVSVVMRLV